MDWITGEIAIGNRIEAQDPGVRAEHGIQAVISLDGSTTDEQTMALGYDDCTCLPFVDGPGNDPVAYRKIVQDLMDLVKSSPPVLVHCHAGRSRSVTVVAGYLVKVNGWAVQAADDLIATRTDARWATGSNALARLRQVARRQALRFEAEGTHVALEPIEGLATQDLVADEVDPGGIGLTEDDAVVIALVPALEEDSALLVRAHVDEAITSR